MTVQRLTADGSTLGINWDASTCGDSNLLALFPRRTNLLYGFTSSDSTRRFDTVLQLLSKCDIGQPPYVWSTPAVPPLPGLLEWWLLVAEVDGVEGSWGADSAGRERQGAGFFGESGVCGVQSKSTLNQCGQ